MVNAEVAPNPVTTPRMPKPNPVTTPRMPTASGQEQPQRQRRLPVKYKAFFFEIMTGTLERNGHVLVKSWTLLIRLSKDTHVDMALLFKHSDIADIL